MDTLHTPPENPEIQAKILTRQVGEGGIVRMPVSPWVILIAIALLAGLAYLPVKFQEEKRQAELKACYRNAVIDVSPNHLDTYAELAARVGVCDATYGKK